MKNASEQTEHRTSPEDESETNRPKSDSRPAGDADQDDLDFVVTEAHDDNPDLIGGYSSNRAADDLGIQSNADIMEREAVEGRSPRPQHLESEPAEFRPIGPDLEATPQAADQQAPPETDFSSVRGASAEPAAPPDASGRLEKLSSEQVEEISRRMRGANESKDYLTEEEKLKLLSDLDRVDNGDAHRGFDNAPITPPKKTNRVEQLHTAVETEIAREQAAAPAEDKLPRMAKRVRGIAHYAGSFIQLTGGQDLHEEDEMTINGRDYVLRRKRISNKLLLGIGIPLAAVAVFAVGAFFSSDAYTGEGQIVGLVLDEYLQPFITGAEIRLPELSRTVPTNGQGFFKTGPVPAGTYKIEYVMAGSVVAMDYATVTDGEVATTTLRPAKTAEQSSVAEQIPQELTTPPASAVSNARPPQGAAEQSAGGSAAPKDQQAAEWAKLKLSANVDGARLSIDGSVLGAGNLTFSKLAPGAHNYSVVKDGYVPAEGTVTLSAGKTKTLTVVLEAKTADKQPAAAGTSDFFASGSEKARLNNFAGALTDLTEAIRLQPSHGDAFAQRAKVYVSLSKPREALDDYIRAAEIFRFSKRYSDAITAYDRALEIDKQSVTAYLGRASLYLVQRQEIAAITDYDMVTRLDKRNLQAYLGLGEARYNQGYYDKAIKHFKDARSIDPENPLIHQYLMLAYMGKGDVKEVKKCYDKYLKCASAEEAASLKTDPQFGAVMRVVEDR